MYLKLTVSGMAGSSLKWHHHASLLCLCAGYVPTLCEGDPSSSQHTSFLLLFIPIKCDLIFLVVPTKSHEPASLWLEWDWVPIGDPVTEPRMGCRDCLRGGLSPHSTDRLTQTRGWFPEGNRHGRRCGNGSWVCKHGWRPPQWPWTPSPAPGRGIALQRNNLLPSPSGKEHKLPLFQGCHGARNVHRGWDTSTPGGAC